MFLVKGSDGNGGCGGKWPGGSSGPLGRWAGLALRSKMPREGTSGASEGHTQSCARQAVKKGSISSGGLTLPGKVFKQWSGPLPAQDQGLRSRVSDAGGTAPQGFYVTPAWAD